MADDTPASPTNIRFVGKRLYAARKAAKLSRFRLAHSIGFAVGPGQIRRYEAGENLPSVEVAIALARVLNVRLKDLTDAES